ncbi:MAG TPA: hypothetical protein VGM06_23960 [Polyangiaceae bacterium]
MRVALIVIGAVVCAALSLEAFAEEPRRTLDMSRAFDAGPLASPIGDVKITATPADPPPLVERGQWVFDLRWDRGDVWLLGIARRELPSPQATPRVMGRFALELFEGPTLIERARFDFPLLGVPEADGGVQLAPKLRTRIGVVFPATRKGTRLELWDRATGRRWTLPWPIEVNAGK